MPNAEFSDSGPLSFHRAISVSGPDPIDRHSVRAVRTAEGLLVVEGLTAPYVQVSRGRRRRRRHRGDVIGTDRSFSSVVCRLRDALRSQRSDSLPVQRSESFGSPLIDDDQRAATGRCDDDADIDASTRKLLPDNDDQTAADEESLEDDASDDGSADHQQSVSGPYDNMAPAPVKKPQREKIGAATFYKDDNGIRRMKLIIDMGKAFHGSDVVLQYIKDDKIQVGYCS